jgi:hypothetical protein
MKHVSQQSFIACIALSILLLLTSNVFAQLRASSPTVPAALTGQHLSFLENKGQWDARARYLLQSGNLNLWITDSGIVYDIYDVSHSVSLERRMRCSREEFRDLKDTITRTGHVVRMTFQNALHSTIAASDTQPGTTNWFIGNDSTKWVTGARTFGRVTIPELYHGVDLVFYLDHGTPRYDLVLKSGADPKQIAMKFEGQDALMKSGNDGLRIKTSMGDIEERELYAYQIVDGQRQQISCAFELAENGSASFHLGAYDHAQPVIIDPLLYSTCLGGGGSEMTSQVALAIDKKGCAYATGNIRSPRDFPTTTGAYQTANAGNRDIFITKLNPTGSALIYSTFLGGYADDWSTGITVDTAGNAFVVGFTWGSNNNFPTTPDSYSPDYALYYPYHTLVTVVSKLNATGTALIYSTYLKADNPNAIATDTAGNAYIVGNTTQLDSSVAPFQKTLRGQADAFISKLSASGSNLLYATYLGGDSDDVATGVTVNLAGEAFVTGWTKSANFPTTSGAFQTTHADSIVAFVTKLRADGSALIYSTYLGGANHDQANGIAIDALGNAFIGGVAGVGYPTTPGAYLTSSNGGHKPFVTKLNKTGNKLLYSTYLTASKDQVLSFVGGIGLDTFGNAYVAGTQRDGMVTTSDAFQATLSGGNGAILVRLNASGSQVLYASYLGGGGLDQGMSIAVDAVGDSYIGGITRKGSNFPTTKGAFQPVSNGEFLNAFIARFSFPIPILSIIADSVAAPYCGTTNVLCKLTNTSGGVLTVDSVSVNDPFTPALGQFPITLQDKTNGQITIKFLPLIGGAFSQPMTIHFRMPDGSARDSVVQLTATSESGSGVTLVAKSSGAKSVAPLSTVNVPVNATLSNAISIDTMQVDEIKYSVAFDSSLLSMDSIRLAYTITPPDGVVFGSASYNPGMLSVTLVNRFHVKLSNQLALGQLNFTANIGAARSTLVQLRTLTLAVKGTNYLYCTTLEGDSIGVVTVEGSAVALQPNGTSIRIFPNPLSKSDLNIEFTTSASSKIEASLLDILGKEVGSIPTQWSHTGANVFQIPTSGLATGSYYLRTLTNGIAETKKIAIH